MHSSEFAPSNHIHDDRYYTETEIDAMIRDISTTIPSFTTNDNGKFLRVINGAVTWSTVPNAEEATF